MTLQRLRGALLRRSLESVLSVGADAAAAATAKSFRQVFTVQPPITVYVRASHAEVTILRGAPHNVSLEADLHASFGWEFATDQDEAGVYIVARRKPIVGALSWAKFSLTVPLGAHLALNLTPGSVHLAQIDGKLILPAEMQ